MATYLLVWNPKRWHWYDEVLARDAAGAGGYETDWTCASKDVQRGDRVFLIKLGAEPRGIIGAGYATGPSAFRPHLDEDRAAVGDTQRYIPVKFDVLLDPSQMLLDYATLSKGRLAPMHWSAQQSGVSIPDKVASALEDAWATLLRLRRAPRPPAELVAQEGLLTEARRYVRGRSRALRERALALAKGVCAACETDYSQWLNGKGVRVLQVHHKHQLAMSDAPRLTRVSDLAVVCANCHALIHMDPRHAVSVEALRRSLQD